jgi:hypothetical protein
MTDLQQTVEHMTEAQRMNEEVHQIWEPRQPTTEAEKICASIDALNRSIDRRMDKLIDTLLLLIRVLEYR